MSQSTLAYRHVEAEILDDLAPGDERAQRSRRDLQRIHRAMGSVKVLKKALARLELAAIPRTVVELGAGDGTLLLRLARALAPRWANVELELLDRHDIVAPATLRAYAELGWRVSVVREDALVWAQSGPRPTIDLCIATLFLHHFDEPKLRALLTGIQTRSRAFIADEPRRNRFAHLGSRLIGLLGTNAVTRNDAVASVAAGFTGDELTQLWPNHARGVDGDPLWWVDEFNAPPFSHCFLAARQDARASLAAGAVRLPMGQE
jgi:hypothetical protein